MLEKPDLPNEMIVACLLEEYALTATRVEFLPLGADQNSAVYRVVAADETPYFLKLRHENDSERATADEMSVLLPKVLGDQGIKQVIAPLTALRGELWATLGRFKVILYPFVAGHNGYEVKVSRAQWRELGTALKRIHSADLPKALLNRIKREDFSPRWREAIKDHLAQAQGRSFADPLAGKLAVYLAQKREEIATLVRRAEQLARTFRARLPEYVLCHADIHAGNILIDDDGRLYIVDWDEAILAPRERDSMFAGGALMGGWRPAQEEETLFYAAYGEPAADPVGIAYYRYERIIADIAVISQQIFSTAGSVEDREQFFGYLQANFQPGDTIEMARRADPACRAC